MAKYVIDGLTLTSLANSVRSITGKSNNMTPGEMATALRETNTELIDRFCPPFTESGAVVSCLPLEGYPLDVEWKTKNLINPVEYMADSHDTTLDGDVFTSTTSNGAVYVNTGWNNLQKTHPKGTYTITVVPLSDNVRLSIIVYSQNNRGILANHAATPENGYSKTFTIDEDFFISIGGGGSEDWGTHSYRLQLEEGTTATAYEPYAETTTITRCEKNLINPVEYMAATKDEDERTTLDGDVFTTRFTSGGIHLNMRYGPCKTHPKGTYTFSFIPLTDGASAYAFVYAKSSGATIAKKELLGSNLSLTFTANEEFYISLGGIHGSPGTYSYKLQLEAGTTATEYEPYKEAETFAIGEPITALKGVNTIYANVGLVTVTGKADPIATINELKNRLAALETGN